VVASSLFVQKVPGSNPAGDKKFLTSKTKEGYEMEEKTRREKEEWKKMKLNVKDPLISSIM